MTDGAMSRRLLAIWAGAAMAGVLGGLLDVALLSGDGLDLLGAEWGRLLGLGIVTGALAGLGSGLLLTPALLYARPRRWARQALGALGLLGVAALVIDATVLVGLYPQAHLLAGVAAVLGLAVAGGVLWPTRGAPVALLAVILAVSASWVGPALLGEGLKLRQVITDHGTLVRRVAALWPEPELTATMGAAQVGCQWPAAQVPPQGGRLAKAPVVLLTIDAWRYDEGLAALPKTAARLSANTVRFTRAYAPANRTTETMYSVLTGRWPHRLRFTPTMVDQQDQPVEQATETSPVDPRTWSARTLAPLHDDTPTLPHFLKAAGYVSATVVAYLFLRPHLGVTRDFDHADIAPYAEGNRNREGITSEHMLARSLAWLNKAPESFFLWLHWMDPHEPYHGFGAVGADADERTRYRAELARVDAALDTLLGDLEAKGILSRAVVILTADHGEEFRDHGGRFHGTTVFEEQVHVPLIIHAPGAVARTVETPVSLMDLAPTLVDLLALPEPPAMDGRSLAAALYGTALTPRPVLVRSSRNGYRYAVIDGHWKLVIDFTRRSIALFDLQADPLERSNRVDETPEVRARLMCLLEAAQITP